MAGVKISQLPVITASALSDVSPWVQGGVTYQASNAQLISLYNAQVTLASTGQVTGLNTALAALAPLAGATFSGTVLLNGTQTASNAAATVAYAQSIAAGLNPIAGVAVATTANLNATYANGVAGVGATLTDASGTFAAFTVDGQSPAVGARVLVKNQTTTYQNGIYVLTTNGDTVSIPYVLTRATDYNMPSQINPGDLTSVELGTANGGSTWYETATVVTIGTSAITWSVFFSPATYLQVANNLSDVASEPTAFANLRNYTTTATAAATTTLTNASTFQQFFTGSTTQTCKLPVTSTLQLGQSYLIVNNSTGVVTVESSGANTIQAMAAGTTLMVTCILLTGTTAASWNAQYSVVSNANNGVTMALKSGSGAGNYTTSSTSYVNMDGTDLIYTITVPTGSKLMVNVSGSGANQTLGSLLQLSLFDTQSSSTLCEGYSTTDAAGQPTPFSLTYILTGDGNSHTISLQYKVSNSSGVVVNNSSTNCPFMTFLLSPSN
jgi:hypothetical protein